MNRLLVDIYIPVIFKSYQMFIPANVKMRKLMPLIESIVQELSYDAYMPSKSSVLCRRDNGSIVNSNATAEQAGIINGTGLILI